MVCVNDLVTLGAMSAVGLRVPEDLGITGYENTFLAGIDTVSLTWVDTEAEQTGRFAASRLDSQESMPSGGTEILIPPRLVIRRPSRQERNRHNGRGAVAAVEFASDANMSPSA